MLLGKKKKRHFSRLMKLCWEGWIIAFPKRFLDSDVLLFFFSMWMSLCISVHYWNLPRSQRIYCSLNRSSGDQTISIFLKASTTIKKNITIIHWSAFPSNNQHIPAVISCAFSKTATESRKVMGGRYKEFTKSETGSPNLGFVFISGKYSMSLHLTYPILGNYLIFGCLSLAKGLSVWKTCWTKVLILNVWMAPSFKKW